MQNEPQILIVDDESKSLSLLINHFRGYPYELLYAKNGKEGFEVATSELPDLILMDWAMPVMNGLEATLKLKSQPETHLGFSLCYVLASLLQKSSRKMMR